MLSQLFLSEKWAWLVWSQKIWEGQRDWGTKKMICAPRTYRCYLRLTHSQQLSNIQLSSVSQICFLLEQRKEAQKIAKCFLKKRRKLATWTPGLSLIRAEPFFHDSDKGFWCNPLNYNNWHWSKTYFCKSRVQITQLVGFDWHLFLTNWVHLLAPQRSKCVAGSTCPAHGTCDW